MTGLVVAGWLLALAPAGAAKPQVVTVTVTDASGAPIPTAWVRVPGAERQRTVDPETGVWAAAFVTEPDGTPRVFVRGMDVELTVTAPGFRPQRIAYRVRSRGNEVPVVLEPVPEVSPLTVSVEEIDTLMEAWFQADEAEE